MARKSGDHKTYPNLLKRVFGTWELSQFNLNLKYRINYIKVNVMMKIWNGDDESGIRDKRYDA